jgi:2-dehydropantoate 2-reductase
MTLPEGRTMRILMFGRGTLAVGYGWALERAGHEIDYYVRPGRAAEYGDTVALDLLDQRRRPWGERVVERMPVRLREDLAPAHYDLVLVSVGHHRLPEAAALLAPRLGDATVLVLGNVWPDPATAVAPLPLDQVAWGFPGGGGGVQADGTVRVGLLPFVQLGTLGGPPARRERAVRELFRGAGFRVREEADIAGWYAVHFMTDAGMLAQGLAHGTLSRMVGDRAALGAALRTGRELLPVLTARGVDLARHRGTTLPLRHPGIVAPLMGWLTAHVAIARLSLAAHTDPHAEEPRALCRDALAEARRLGIRAPLLEELEPLFATTSERA